MNPQQYPPNGQRPSGTPGWPANPGGFQAPNGGYGNGPQGPQGYTPMPYNTPGYGPQPGMPPAPGMPPGYQQQQHTAGYNPNPFPGEAEKSSSGPSRTIIRRATIGVVVFFLLILGLKLINDARQIPGNGKPGTTTDTPGTPDVGTRTDDKLDLSQRINPQTSLKEQSLQGGIKQQFNLSSGFSFMVTDVQLYTPTDTTIQPAAGKKFIRVSVVVGNRGQSQSLSISYLDFKLRNGRNELLTGDPATIKLLNNYLASPASIDPGSQVSGSIIFQVDSAASEWALVHSETYHKVTDGTDFSVQGSVALTLPTATPTTTTPTP